MTEEQLHLIAAILDTLCGQIPVLPYQQFGANVGQCSCCGAIGQVKYPDIVWKHAETCAIALNEQLQASLEQKE